VSLRVLVAADERTSYFLSRRLIAAGHEVVVIHESEQVCRSLARRLGTTLIHGDATDPRVLEDAGAGSADAVLALTATDARNLAICRQARLRFGILRALAVANDPDNEEVFRVLGVDVAYSPTRVLAALVEQRAQFADITNLISVADGRIHLTEVKILPTARVVGRPLQHAGLPAGTVVAYLLRNDLPVVPHGRTEILAGDRLMLVTLPGQHGPALEALTAKRPEED
jgi:trk system potassium uptake protein TrkA